MSQLKAEYIDHMGDDLSVVRAARVSFAADPEANFEFPCVLCGADVVKGEPCRGSSYDREEKYCGSWSTKRLSERDQKLIAYLAKHHHWTPFAHTSITFRCSASVPNRPASSSRRAASSTGTGQGHLPPTPGSTSNVPILMLSVR